MIRYAKDLINYVTYSSSNFNELAV